MRLVAVIQYGYLGDDQLYYTAYVAETQSELDTQISSRVADYSRSEYHSVKVISYTPNEIYSIKTEITKFDRQKVNPDGSISEEGVDIVAKKPEIEV